MLKAGDVDRVKMKDIPSPDQAKSPLFHILNGGGLRQYVFNNTPYGHPLNSWAVDWLTKRLWMFSREKDMHCVLLRSVENSKNTTFSVGMEHKDQLRKVQSNDGTINPKDFQELYQLCYLISRQHKPFLCYFNGRTAGNSSALGVHSPYRIVNEKSSFDLAQTGYGFFPDAGLSYFLSRLDGELGMYLALTGKTLKGTDLMHAGIGTHYQLEDEREMFVKSLETTLGFYDTVHERLAQADVEWTDTEFSLAPHLEAIQRCFSRESVEAIRRELATEDTDWARETLLAMDEKSPISLLVTYKLIQDLRWKDLESSLKIEYDVAMNFLKHADYAEGVKATRLEFRPPKWSKSLVQYRPSEIDEFFKPVAGVKKLALPFLDYPDPYDVTFQAAKGYGDNDD